MVSSCGRLAAGALKASDRPSFSFVHGEKGRQLSELDELGVIVRLWSLFYFVLEWQGPGLWMSSRAFITTCIGYELS